MSKGKGNYFQLPSFNGTMTENVLQYTITLLHTALQKYNCLTIMFILSYSNMKIVT